MTATDDASALAGTDGGRTRPCALTSTGLTRGRCRTPVWLPHDHQVPPKSVPVLVDYAFLSDYENTCLISRADRGNGGACPTRTPPAHSADSWTNRAATSGSALRGVGCTTQRADRLRGPMYSPTAALLAAHITSPETPRGGWNSDHRYAWGTPGRELPTARRPATTRRGAIEAGSTLP